MTRKVFSIGLAFLLAMAGLGNIGAARAAATGSDVAAIDQVMDQAQAAWNRGDVVGFMHCYKDAPDTTFVGSSVRKGYQAVLAGYRKAYANKAQMGQLTFSALDVRLLPGSGGEVRYAIMTGHYHLDRNAHGEASKDDGVFSLVWEKTQGGWKIILDHSN
ncbi:SgcJ/EcaC family oxidoreductase [Rhodanobacter sp. Si-c]|uniref:SgcJ/EcaC family oxidoreductase n=1 Tax=Rhodanobacter lycopersici TaxID=3162487 RepID=A0ABV3QHL6_9GAMM